jgi:hypothetical protein
MIPVSRLSTRRTDGKTSLGTLSVHFEGRVCRVGCEFCYLGAREGADGPLDLGLLRELIGALEFDELAVALSEPVEPWLEALTAMSELAAARKRPLAVTTTLPVAQAYLLQLDGVDRVNLSVDPRKGVVDAPRIDLLAQRLEVREVALVVSLVTPGFAADLIERGLLENLVDLRHVDAVVLNALKPPPEWCGQGFWMRTLAQLRPLLERSLDRKLFLDCWVAARLLGLGDCPARPDLTPTAGGFAFRGCVYQAAAERVLSAPDPLSGFVATAVCPFEIPS